MCDFTEYLPCWFISARLRRRCLGMNHALVFEDRYSGDELKSVSFDVHFIIESDVLTVQLLTR